MVLDAGFTLYFSTRTRRLLQQGSVRGAGWSGVLQDISIAIILLSSHNGNHRHPTHRSPGGRCCPHLRITVSSHVAGSSLERDAAPCTSITATGTLQVCPAARTHSGSSAPASDHKQPLPSRDRSWDSCHVEQS